jgi:CubicO group peptidase (beta-lactamase class C family)
MFKVFKKWLKRLGWFLFYLIIALNLFIVLSGRFYLYKGVYSTYLRGESGPTIYDFDKFHEVKVEKSKTTVPWKFDLTENKLSKSDLSYIEKLNSTSFLVIKNDKVIFEKYWGEHHPTTISNSFSAAKTIVSLLVGFAIEDGKIKSLDDKVCKYLKHFEGEGKENITIRHLLMMASGLDWVESGKNPLSENAESYYGWDLWNLVHRQRVATEPGKLFFYQSGNSQLLGFIVEKATGKSLNEYASEKLWKPIGAESDAFWSLDRENGDEKAFCCLYATTRDFARIGKLLNNHGKWNDKQVIPADFFDELIKNPKMNTEEGVPNTRYGLHIWTYHENGKTVIYCRGIKGQYIIAVPEEQLIIVRTGHKRADDYEIPKNIKHPSQAMEEKVGHPGDLFEYLRIARGLVK